MEQCKQFTGEKKIHKVIYQEMPITLFHNKRNVFKKDCSRWATNFSKATQSSWCCGLMGDGGAWSLACAASTSMSGTGT